jgi:hypothetical protein
MTVDPSVIARRAQPDVAISELHERTRLSLNITRIYDFVKERLAMTIDLNVIARRA